MRQKTKYYKKADLDVSTHAPVKDATFLMQTIKIKYICFNPRTRKGCDEEDVLNIKELRQVSTHAPVKDATKTIKMALTIKQVSTHAPVKDATYKELHTVRLVSFQPTHP